MNGQLEKNDMTKVALQKLCDALKTQVSLKDEENNLKLQEETQKRIEIAQNFEATMNELTKLIESHSSHNTSLRTENAEMTKQMEALLQEYEKREGKISSVRFRNIEKPIFYTLKVWREIIFYRNKIFFFYTPK